MSLIVIMLKSRLFDFLNGFPLYFQTGGVISLYRTLEFLQGDFQYLVDGVDTMMNQITGGTKDQHARVSIRIKREESRNPNYWPNGLAILELAGTWPSPAERVNNRRA